MGAFLFANPSSGRYDSNRITEATGSLRSKGIPVTVFAVRNPEEINACCRNIYEMDAYPLIIVAAGDGTFNAVLNSQLPATATLAILPLGTSNVLAAELGIVSLRDGIKRIVRGDRRPFSVGQIEFENRKLRFALMAGIGLDGAVVRDVRQNEKRLLRQGAYALSSFRNCFSWDNCTMEVVTPEETIECHTAVISNVSRYGGDFVLAPGSGLFSPGFTVSCVCNSGRRTYLRIAVDLLMGRGRINSGKIHRMLAREVEIRGCRPIQLDGDFVGYSSAKLTTVSDACQIIV